MVINTTDHVDFGKEASNGCFDNEKKELLVSIGKPQEKWLRILVHESCHCDQWFEQAKVWNEYEKSDNPFDWIQGKGRWSKTRVHKAIAYSRELELDCEKRTVAKIKKYKLPIDVAHYEREATAYVLFYTFMELSRKWYKIGHEPYNNEKLIAILKDGFETDFTKVTEKQKKLFEECV